MALLANIVRAPVKARCSSSTGTRQCIRPKDSVQGTDNRHQIQLNDDGAARQAGEKTDFR